MDLTPVDYVSRAVVALSRKPESIGGTYHIVNPHVVSASSLWRELGALGYPLEVRPYGQWLSALGAAASSSEDNALASLLPVIQALPPEDRTAAGPRMVRCDCRSTLAALAGTGVACPPVDGALLATYVADLVHRGFLEAGRHS
jgi:thioester reductase-like protein